MAIENALLSLLFDAPVTALSEVLRRRYALSAKAADGIAVTCALAFLVGLCFLAWYLFEYQ